MVLTLDAELKNILLSSVKILIPHKNEQEMLFDALRKYQSSLDLPTLMSDLRTVINDPDKSALYEEIRPLIPLKQQIEYDSLCPIVPDDTLKVIRLRRYLNESLGFAIRGGLEHGIGIYVSEISTKSAAYQQGLRIGDEIVRVNGFTIAQAIHDEVLNLIKTRSEIVLKISRIGMLPVREKPNDQLRWEYVPKDIIESPSGSSESKLSGKVVKIFINMSGSIGLGCRIVSGPPSHPGIFIQFVKAGGLAEEAGLEVGDQIISVNDTSFLKVSHSEAVVALKSTKHLFVNVRKGASSPFKDTTDAPNVLQIPDVKTDVGIVSHSPKRREAPKRQMNPPLPPPPPVPAMLSEANIIKNEIDRHSITKVEVHQPKSKPQSQTNGYHTDSLPSTSDASVFNPPSPNIPDPPPPTRELTVESDTNPVLRRGKCSFYEEVQRRQKKEEEDKMWRLRMQQFEQDKAEIMRESNMKSVSKSNNDNLPIDSNFILKKSPAPVAPDARTSKSSTGSMCEDLTEKDALRLFSSAQIGGRQIRLIKLRMNGPIGLELEGGLDTPLNGKINVSNILDGSAHRQGGIHVSDQLMMADNIKLIDVTLMQAENVLDLAAKKSGDLVKFIIAVAPPINYEEEATYF